MRVLITSPVFPPDLGGPAVYVPSVARHLVERGHQVRVVAFCSDPDPRGYPFEVVSIGRGRLVARYLRAFVEVWKAARWADVVYVNEHLALLHVAAARLAGRPVVIRLMVDGAWEISHRRGWIGGDDITTFETKSYGARVRLTRGLQRLWWAGCRRLVACSDFLRDIAVGRYGVPAEKVVRIHNAYHGPRREDLPLGRDEARRELGLDPAARYLLTICRLMVWKRVDGILEALRDLPEDVHLLVAGDGPEEETWKRRARELGLGARAHFLGNVSYDQIPLYITATDIFVLNSEYEGLSHTLLEVQALGTPIVCTGVCGNPEVVEDGVSGLLVPPRDPGRLRAALARLLDDPGLGGRLAQAGLEASRRFTREATFPLVEQVLAGAAGRRQTPDGEPAGAGARPSRP